jgi:hypothetical protein
MFSNDITVMSKVKKRGRKARVIDIETPDYSIESVAPDHLHLTSAASSSALLKLFSDPKLVKEVRDNAAADGTFQQNGDALSIDLNLTNSAVSTRAPAFEQLPHPNLSKDIKVQGGDGEIDVFLKDAPSLRDYILKLHRGVISTYQHNKLIKPLLAALSSGAVLVLSSYLVKKRRPGSPPTSIVPFISRVQAAASQPSVSSNRRRSYFVDPEVRAFMGQSARNAFNDTVSSSIVASARLNHDMAQDGLRSRHARATAALNIQIPQAARARQVRAAALQIQKAARARQARNTVADARFTAHRLADKKKKPTTTYDCINAYPPGSSILQMKRSCAPVRGSRGAYKSAADCRRNCISFDPKQPYHLYPHIETKDLTKARRKRMVSAQDAIAAARKVRTTNAAALRIQQAARTMVAARQVRANAAVRIQKTTRMNQAKTKVAAVRKVRANAAVRIQKTTRMKQAKTTVAAKRAAAATAARRAQTLRELNEDAAQRIMTQNIAEQAAAAAAAEQAADDVFGHMDDDAVMADAAPTTSRRTSQRVAKASTSQRGAKNQYGPGPTTRSKSKAASAAGEKRARRTRTEVRTDLNAQADARAEARRETKAAKAAAIAEAAVRAQDTVYEQASVRSQQEAREQAQAQAHARAEAKARAHAKAQSDAKATAKADARASAKAKAKADAKADANAKAKADANAKAKADEKAYAKANAKANGTYNCVNRYNPDDVPEGPKKLRAFYNNVCERVPVGTGEHANLDLCRLSCRRL